jgi:hypothetical protein
MMALNGVVACLVLAVLFALFGVGNIIEARLAASSLTADAAKWSALLPMLPGAAILFGCLWYWLVVIGRAKGLPWGAACLYGVFLACGNVPLSGLLMGLLHGNPLLGMLIALVMLLMLPSLLVAMICFGLTMGAFNGLMAARWIERHRS